jgi:sugar/nucleoside kinase (ribokinase family)
MKSGIGPEGKGTLVVRAGREGCYAYCQGYRLLALPAYPTTVVDPTGAGNAFLGALAQALVSAGRMPMKAIESTILKSETLIDVSNAWAEQVEWPMALICATVAASFVVEQVGVPNLSFPTEGEEFWNGMSFTERIHLYIKQLIETLERSSQDRNSIA